jgi:hypothetical protein
VLYFFEGRRASKGPETSSSKRGCTITERDMQKVDTI